MAPSRKRNGAGKASQLNDSGRRRRRKARSPPSLLVRCAHSRIALASLFASILLSWVSIVALFLSTLPSNNRAGGAVSPLSAKQGLRRHLRALSSVVQRIPATTTPPILNTEGKPEKIRHRPLRKKQKKSDPIPQYGTTKERAAALLLAKVPQNKLNKARTVRENSGNNLRAIHQRTIGGFERKEMHSQRQQSVLDALVHSEPYVQKRGAASPGSDAISAFAAELYWSRRDSMNEDDDSLDTYYAMDDDGLRGKYDNEQFCSTPSFYRLYRPTCNEVHSTVSGYDWLAGEEYRSEESHRSRFLGAGSYRQAFLLERQAISDFDEVVFKSMKRFKPDNGRHTLEERAAYNPDEVYKTVELYDDMRKDSMVMEQLTSSPRIADIYSFCALSSIIEYAPMNLEDYVLPTGGEKEGDDDDPTPVNVHIKPQKKLEMALELAKGLAAMHGHPDGVIVNVDVQIGQFCGGKDGALKVLDFNRAEVMMYDEEHDEYCRFSNGPPPDGSLRSPEEIVDAPLTEKIDVYSLGNVFYQLLTGLTVNTEYSVEKSHWRITHGKTEEIDTDFFESRSEAEKALVKAIRWCWTFDAELRPSIFQIVELLEQEVRKNLDDSESGPSRSQ